MSKRRARAYSLDALSDLFPEPIIAQRAPSSQDFNFPLGQVWVDKINEHAYVLVGVKVNEATWEIFATASGPLNTLSGDSGTATPTSNNIEILGGTNLTSVASGDAVTINLNAAISLATSVTSPVYTTSGADMNINSAANQNILMRMGDDSGARKISFLDSSSAEVGSINSNGAMELPNMTVANIISPSSSDLRLQSATGQDVNVRLGDTSGATSVSIQDSGASEVADIDSNGNATALSFNTSNAANSIQLSQNVFLAQGTSTNLGFVFVPKGNGDVDVVTGDIRANDGHLTILGDGKQLQVNGGAATDFIGSATLSTGTVTIANTNISDDDRIFLSYIGGSLSDTGALSYTISAGTSFTIESTNASDDNDVAYFIVRQV